jgi:UDP-2-acetamido-2,6-beta-L-arabino-hexul-4-ose reductase
VFRLKILVTGSRGFIGKNLMVELQNRGYTEIYRYDKDTDAGFLAEYTRDCEFVFHLAGINRPDNEKEFMDGNFGFTSLLLDSLREHNNTCPIVISSSIQAELDNPYGRSKKAGEELLFDYGKETGAKVLVYRFPNVFGKWCQPNYNSVIATFCHNIARGLPIRVNDRETMLNLVYIDEVVTELINALKGHETKIGDYCHVPIVHSIGFTRNSEPFDAFRKTYKTHVCQR